MPRLILLNKPFQVLCQFSPEGDKQTLKDYVPVPDVYPAGRLDYDSEGLVVLTDAGYLQHLISDPKHKTYKTYWAQVERIPDQQALEQLKLGVELKDGMTRPAIVKQIPEPEIWDRNPPIRERKNVPTAWIELQISEGRNRQVRRMTAAVGYPTLRLIRQSVGPWSLQKLQPGEWVEVPCPKNREELLSIMGKI
ncbi:MAG: pseudouridine synthase [Cyclobacteriaceae bacterium]